MRRLFLLALLLAALLFAIQGGEYGTTDLVRQRARERKLLAQIDTLQRQVDSLTRYRKALLTHPAPHERIAREGFGINSRPLYGRHTIGRSSRAGRSRLTLGAWHCVRRPVRQGSSTG